MVVSTAIHCPTDRIGFLDWLHGPGRPVLVFDGATGTSLQEMDLTAEDFGGAEGLFVEVDRLGGALFRRPGSGVH